MMGKALTWLTFSCRDLAGNEAETLVVPEFTIDRTAPKVSVKFNEQTVIMKLITIR